MLIFPQKMLYRQGLAKFVCQNIVAELLVLDRVVTGLCPVSAERSSDAPPSATLNFGRRSGLPLR
jgi:hypothetical protein